MADLERVVDVAEAKVSERAESASKSPGERPTATRSAAFLSDASAEDCKENAERHAGQRPRFPSPKSAPIAGSLSPDEQREPLSLIVGADHSSPEIDRDALPRRRCLDATVAATGAASPSINVGRVGGGSGENETEEEALIGSVHREANQCWNCGRPVHLRVCVFVRVCYHVYVGDDKNVQLS